MLRRLNSAFNVSIFLTVYIVLFLFTNSLLSQPNATFGLGLNSLGVPVTPLFDNAGNHLQITNGQIAPDFKLMPRSYRHEMNFDSTGTYVVVQESLLKEPFNLTHKISLDEYLKYAQDNRESIYWNKQTQRYLSGELNPRSSNSTGLEITVPVKIKSKAFQTIFGGDRVKLSVNGNINIKGGFRHEDRDQVKTMITDGSDFNFKMEQTQQFQVQGHIGEKVTVSVDQNSERAFDFENTLKLTYTGYDDEIIQSIEAGNVSLSLPATRFISYSNTNSGLFGIKMVAQLGNLSMTAITSQEKGESQELSVTGGAVDSEPKKIWDYNYVKNKYFFLGKEYLENYWPTDENGYHTNFAEFEIQRLEVYKSDYGYENDPQVIKAWALNDSLIRIYSRGEEFAPDVLTSSNPQIGKELYNGYFKRLELNRDYFFNPISGVLSFGQTLSENEVIGVAYSYGKTEVDTIGDLVATGNADIFLKLIKTRTARPEYSTWELMLRNIYSIGRNTSPEDFEVKIFRVASDGTDQEVGTIQGTESETASYLNIMGLDVVNNTTGASEPDNQVDMRETTVRTTEG
ncbi:hypothetical protein KAH55_13465, partial [bacterium]|nr:hypothetical protein [bacterium]